MGTRRREQNTLLCPLEATFDPISLPLHFCCESVLDTPMRRDATLFNFRPSMKTSRIFLSRDEERVEPKRRKPQTTGGDAQFGIPAQKRN